MQSSRQGDILPVGLRSSGRCTDSTNGGDTQGAWPGTDPNSLSRLSGAALGSISGAPERHIGDTLRTGAVSLMGVRVGGGSHRFAYRTLAAKDCGTRPVASLSDLFCTDFRPDNLYSVQKAVHYLT